MRSDRRSYIFDADRVVGNVIEVTPSTVKVSLGGASVDEPELRYGDRIGAGEVGEFLMIEAGDIGIFGRMTNVRLPERDRTKLGSNSLDTAPVAPVGTIEMLTTVPADGSQPLKGITRFPRVGARVFSLHSSIITWIAESSSDDSKGKALRLDLAYLPGSLNASVRVTPERLFGRHLAILGATGGGKSWTVARIVERCSQFKAKVILLDATGEYHKLGNRVKHVSIGSGKDRPDNCEQIAMPYRDLEELDLFAMFTPSGQVQAPRLRAAIKSLKLAEILGDADSLVQDGCILKAGQSKSSFEQAYAQNAATIEGPEAHFDASKLTKQIEHECVWPSAWGQAQGQRDFSKWGGADEGQYSNCVNLVARIESAVASSDMAPIFGQTGIRSARNVIQEFLDDSETSVLRISLRYLAFRQSLREIVANGIGRVLLGLARDEKFANLPLVVCVDEAHQFLNKWLGDEYTRYPLDAFELIAKEGRKYSLSICLATQRPRDLPDGIIGQMGAMLIHRLTHGADRDVVDRSAGDIDRSAASFLPTLAPGQALLLGIDHTIPLVIQVAPPDSKPDSAGPDFQAHWQALAADPSPSDSDDPDTSADATTDDVADEPAGAE